MLAVVYGKRCNGEQRSPEPRNRSVRREIEKWKELCVFVNKIEPTVPY